LHFFCGVVLHSELRAFFYSPDLSFLLSLVFLVFLLKSQDVVTHSSFFTPARHRYSRPTLQVLGLSTFRVSSGLDVFQLFPIFPFPLSPSGIQRNFGFAESTISHFIRDPHPANTAYLSVFPSGFFFPTFQLAGNFRRSCRILLFLPQLLHPSGPRKVMVLRFGHTLCPSLGCSVENEVPVHSAVCISAGIVPDFVGCTQLSFSMATQPYGATA